MLKYKEKLWVLRLRSATLMDKANGNKQVRQVDQNQLEQIGDYVKSHIGQWIREQNILTFTQQERSRDRDTELLERMVRVEEGIKNQIEITRQGFENMEKRFVERFEAVDKRFEDMQHYMDKRFNVQTWIISAGFAMMTILMSLYQFLG